MYMYDIFTTVGTDNEDGTFKSTFEIQRIG